MDSARGENIPRRELGLANRVAATTRGDTTAEGAPQDWPTEISLGGAGPGLGRSRSDRPFGAPRERGVCVAIAGAMAGAGSSAESSSGAG